MCLLTRVPREIPKHSTRPPPGCFLSLNTCLPNTGRPSPVVTPRVDSETQLSLCHLLVVMARESDRCHLRSFQSMRVQREEWQEGHGALTQGPSAPAHTRQTPEPNMDGQGHTTAQKMSEVWGMGAQGLQNRLGTKAPSKVPEPPTKELRGRSKRLSSRGR